MTRVAKPNLPGADREDGEQRRPLLAQPVVGAEAESVVDDSLGVQQPAPHRGRGDRRHEHRQEDQRTIRRGRAAAQIPDSQRDRGGQNDRERYQAEDVPEGVLGGTAQLRQREHPSVVLESDVGPRGGRQQVPVVKGQLDGLDDRFVRPHRQAGQPRQQVEIRRQGGDRPAGQRRTQCLDRPGRDRHRTAAGAGDPQGAGVRDFDEHDLEHPSDRPTPAPVRGGRGARLGGSRAGAPGVC